MKNDKFDDYENFDEKEDFNEDFDDEEIVKFGKDEKERNMKKNKLKTVTIRGIDSVLYDQFSKSVQSINLRVGEAISRMMDDVIKDFDDTLPKISSTNLLRDFMPTASINHINKVIVTKKDFEDAKTKFTFNSIEYLEFGPDVTLEIFNKYVSNISHCNKVRIPNILPRLLLLSKINGCDDIEVYDPEESE